MGTAGTRERVEEVGSQGEEEKVAYRRITEK